MEGSVLANPTRRQASGADTALSNAVTSVTVSQQESEGQASEPAAGSTGGPPSPRAARSQVSTAVSFEGARAAGSAVQPERSVDEDSALSAAEPDGHIQPPRPANSLISTAVHRTFRNTSTGGKLALLAQQHHASQQRHQQAHQQALLLQHLQQYQAQQQRYALPALLAQAAHGRGAGPSADHYASSPEVQRPHSINSQAAETRGEGHGHAGRDAAEHTTAPGYGARGHPSRSNARGATPASVHGQIQTLGGAPGSPSTRKARHQGIQWHNAIGGGSSGLGGMDPAAAAAAAAAAFLGNGLVGGWGLMQGLGQGAAQSIGAAGQCQPPLPHSFLAAAAAGASGTRPLPSSPFNFAALGHLQLQTASHLQQQAAAAAASAGASVGMSGDADASVLWQSPEQNDGVLAGRALPQPPGGSMQAAAAPVSKQHREDYRQLLPPSPQQQLLQAQVPPATAINGGDGAGSSAEDAGDGWRGGGGDTNRTAPGGPRGSRERKAASKDLDASRQRARQARPPYGLPAALLGPMYGGGHHQFALADMHGLQELLMSASMTAAAAAAVAASGVIRPAEDGAQMLSTSGSARPNQDQPQLNHFSSQLGPGPQHLIAHPQHQSFAAHGTSLHAQQQHHHNHQEEAYMSPVSGYVHTKQQGEAFGPGNVEAAAMASSAAGRTGAGATFSPAAAGGTAMQAPIAAAAMTATSVCGDDHGMVVDGSVAAGPLQGTGASPSAHPAMQLYVPVMLPLDLVSAQLVMHQAAAAVAVAAGTSSQVANAGDAKGSGPSGGMNGGGVNGAPPLGSAGAAVHTIHSTKALKMSPQCFAGFAHESCHQDEPDASVGGRSHGSDGDACGRSQVATCAVATSVARGVGPNINGNGAGGLGTVMLAASGHADSGPARSEVADARDRTGNAAGPSSPQHSAGSYPGADSAGAGILNFQPGTLGGHTGAQEGHTAVAPLAVSAVETASVAAPGAPADVGLPPEDMAEHSGAAGGGATVSGSGAAGGAAATASAGFGAVGPNHHNLMNNAHSNAYGAGPSMTQTADYRSHLQVALSLLLQATSAAYHSQRQSGIAGANDGSGVFAAGAQQASASNAVEMEMSEGAGGSGAGAGCAAGGVGSRNNGDAGVVSSGGAAGGSGPGRSAHAGGLGSGADNRATSSGGTAAAATAAHSMRGVLLGPAGATGAMETEGQVVDQAPAVGRGLHAGPSTAGTAAGGGALRDGVAGANLRHIGDGVGDCSDGGGARASPDAYQAPQWSTQRGGGGGGGILDEGARSIMYGSSGEAALAGQGSSLKGGGGGAAGTHAHMSTHHGLSMGHQHHHHHRHHAQGLPQSPISHYHHHRAGCAAAVGSGSASGKAAALEGQGCSPGLAQLEGGLMIGGGHGGGTVVAAAGASVGSAGGGAAGDGEQGDNNSALQMDAEAGHPAASVHATVIAEESDASQEGGGGGGDDSDSMEVPPVVAGRGLNGSAAGTGGGGAVTGQGGRVAAAAGSSMAAREACLGEIASKLFEGSRSPSREGQASKQPHDQVLFLQQGPPAAGVGLGEVASHRAEARSPARHDGGFLDPRDSSMGMAAGPSHDGADSSSNGATTSDTVDMADDSRMGSASEHDDSRMGVNPRDRLLVDDYHLPMDEQGGENGGTVGDGGQDVEERGDDNGNAGSVDVRSGRGGRHGRGRGRNADGLDGNGDGDGSGRMSVGLAAALLGMLGGRGDGRATIRHMGPAMASDGKDSPAEKAVSHQADNNPQDQVQNHHQPGNHYHTQTAGMEVRRGGSAGVGHRASNNGTAPIAHHNNLVLHHHHHGTAAAKAVAAVALYGACAAATVAALAGDMSAAAPAASGAATMGAAADGSGGEAPRVSLQARGSPALQAANSTAIGSARHGHCSPCQLGGEESGGKRQEAAGYTQPRVPHMSREDRRPVGAAAATAISCGLGPAYSASNADRLKMGGRIVDGTTGLGGALRTSRSNGAAAVGLIPRTATSGGAAAPVASSGDAAAGEGGAKDVIVKSSSQEAAGGVRHRKSSGRPEAHVRSRDGRQYLQRGQNQLPPPSQQHQVQRVRNEGELASSPGAGTNVPSSHPMLLQPHPIHHHPYLQQQQHDSHTQVQQFAALASAMTVANVQQIPSHHTYPEVQPHGHHHRQHDVVNANANTTLAAVNGGATLNQASILTTASQPPPPPLPLLMPHQSHQPYNALTPESGSNAARLRGWSSAGNAASVGRGHGTGGAAAAVGFSIGGVSVKAPAMTHGSAGRGHGPLADRFSQEAEPQVTEIHGAFPGIAATAAEALALHEEEEWQRSTAAVSAAEAAMAAAAGPAAADAQASWMGHGEERQPSGSPGGRSFSAVVPQFTEVHGAFMRTAGTAAEAQAAVLRGAGDSSNRDAGAGASGEKPGGLDPRVSDGRGQCTLQAGARLTAPRDAEYMGVSITHETGGGVAGVDGRGSQWQGLAAGTSVEGVKLATYHPSEYQELQPAAGGASGLGAPHQQSLTAAVCGSSTAATGAVATRAAAGGGGPPGLGAGTAVTSNNSDSKAESALHLTPASRAASRGAGSRGGGGGGGWTLRSGRAMGSHDGQVAVPRRTRGGAAISVDGHGSNGGVPPEPCDGDNVAAMAAVSQSGEVMLPPQGHNVGGAASAAGAVAAVMALGGITVAAADMRHSSRRVAAGHPYAGDPALSGSASHGPGGDDGDVIDCGAITPDTRRLARHGLRATTRGLPGRPYRIQSTLLHPLQQLPPQPQPGLQLLAGSDCGGGAATAAAAAFHAQEGAEEGPLSTQAHAYGGYDDEYDSDGLRRRMEGPPQPQMTILVTSQGHAANSHHTVSGGAAVGSEADNGIAGAEHGGGGGSPAVAAWEEEFDGPHRPTGVEGLAQQGSWRGGEGDGDLGGGPTKSAVMSSGRVEAPPHSHQSIDCHRHHHHHLPQHPRYDPHDYLASHGPLEGLQSGVLPNHSAAGGAWAVGAAVAAEQPAPMQLSDGEVVGSGGGGSGRGTTRGMRRGGGSGGRGRIRGSKRKRTLESSEPDEDSKLGGSGGRGGSGGCR